MNSPANDLSALPSVDRMLNHGDVKALIADHGRAEVVHRVRETLAGFRQALKGETFSAPVNMANLVASLRARLEEDAARSLRRVFNLTGTVLHTNLGRAMLPEAAIEAVCMAARHPATLEYDLDSGGRGDRDAHLERLICRLTGAEAATVVNNNAAAVWLVLSSLASGRDVITSRGELIEIGGSFRMPDIMAVAGCRLMEVGTTNRTHLHDFARAIGPRTGLVMKVHASNFSMSGFTAEAPERDLANLCHRHGLPFCVDLGSGALIDLSKFGLPREPTPSEALARGADVVTFSGDKLLGGPQAGLILGRGDLIAKIRQNPLKRALRVDKLTMAALASVLGLYLNPDRLRERLPTLRLLTRPASDIAAAAARIQPVLASALASRALVWPTMCRSQIGSGAQPDQTLESAGLRLTPIADDGQGAGSALVSLAKSLRALPIPVLGRLHDESLLLDFRCLDDEAGFLAQLDLLRARDRPLP